MNEESIKIELTKDEAIVLYEFLQRSSNSDELKIEHQAEERALWNLACIFEKVLAEPFMLDYARILTSARERLKDKE